MKVLFSGNHAMASQAREIYALIRKNGPATRQSLCQQLSQPATTVSRALDRLILAGLISESGLADSSGGRRPILYQTIGTSYYLLGLDLAAGLGQLVLTDLDLQVAAICQLEDLAGQSAEKQAALVGAACTSLLEQIQITPEKILGLGVALPESGEPEPISAAMVSQVAASLQVPLFQANGVQAIGSLARWRHEALPGNGFLELCVSRQVQLRLVLDGWVPAVIPPAERTSQMVVPAPDRSAGSDNRGTLAGLASQTSILQRFRRVKDNPDLTWADFCQAVQAGKRKSGQILLEAAEAMAIAVYNASLLTGCSNLILDGSLWLDLPESIQALQDKLAEIQAADAPALEVQVVRPESSQRAAGAAALVLEYFLGESL